MNRPVRRPVLLVTALLVSGLLVTALLGPHPGATDPAGATGPARSVPAAGATAGLRISTPAALIAGGAAAVVVTGAADGVVGLVAIGSLGTSSFTAVSSGGSARFDLPVGFTRTSGTVTLLAAAGSVTARSSIEVVPGPAGLPVQSVVGARSIVADGHDLSMVVTIPIDSWGNAVADGTDVLVSRSSPTGTASSATVLVSHLVGWQELPSGTFAGRGFVWAAAQGRTGPRVSLDEVAGPPLPFTLTAVDPALAGRTGADGQTLIPVRTSLLRDRYGNVEPDGTSVMVSWVGPAGSSVAEALTVAGVAQLSVQVPSAAQTFTLTAQCRGVDTAGPLRLTFGSAVADVPIAAHRAPPDLSVIVGPINRTSGTFVPDGTTAAVVVLDGPGHRVSGTGELVDGRITLLLPSAGLVGPLTVTASVLGTSRSIAVP